MSDQMFQIRQLADELQPPESGKQSIGNGNYHAGTKFLTHESVVTTKRSDRDGKTAKSVDAQTGEDF